ncbi:MAG: zinc ABC transporter substrate-binding protein [Ruminococcus sp.]|nr:zinc ABC transporter substrate-binding protein [Ruminococcus sp.]
MKKRLFVTIITAVLFVSGLLTGCADSSAEKKPDKLSIVTTCFPPYDFARAVAGESADITMLLCPSAEAHSYEPTPLDILKIQECDVFIYLGGSGEVWAEEILESVGTDNKTVIRLFDYVEPLEEEEVRGASPNGHSHDHSHNEEEEEEDSHSVQEQEHHHDENCGHNHAENDYLGYDEHFWLSPSNAVLCTEGIRDALCSAVPEHISFDRQSYYSVNAEGYISQLKELEEDFAEMAENAPTDIIVIGDRFPFRYLTHDLGLEYFAAFSGCSSESEPGVYTMAFLIDEILEHNIDTVFCLEFSTKRLAEKLCDATGAQMLTLHSCHNVSGEDFENNVTYIQLMRENLNNLREALY